MPYRPWLTPADKGRILTFNLEGIPGDPQRQPIVAFSVTGAVVEIWGNLLVRQVTGRQFAEIYTRDVSVVVENGAFLVYEFGHSHWVKLILEPMLSQGAPRFADLQSARGWFQGWLLTSALPLWWTLGADHVAGGYHECLAQADACPLPSPRRVRVQARQTHVFARAGRMGWMGPWADAAWHGLSYILTRYRRSDGFYQTMIEADGEAGDGAAFLYDQSFVLLALASLFECEPRRSDLRTTALALWSRIQQDRAPNGGYYESGSEHLLANPHMHLFEAVIAWARLDPETWMPHADELARLVIDRMVDHDQGLIREIFDMSWRPAEGQAGRTWEPGHQYEWAWLLDQYCRLRGDSDARTVASILFRNGAKGIDAARDVAVAQCLDEAIVLDGNARLWPQTERLRAALAFGDSCEALRAANSVARFLDVPVRGLWRDMLMESNEFQPGPAPASSFYHLFGALSLCLNLPEQMG